MLVDHPGVHTDVATRVNSRRNRCNPSTRTRRGRCPLPARSVVVPSDYQYLKRWHFVLVVACVWAIAAAAGWGLYYWWYHSLDKTAPVFVVLVYLILCTVVGLLVAMVQNRPVMSALAIAFMSAPLAATAGAAVLHGLYFCGWASSLLRGADPLLGLGRDPL